MRPAVKRELVTLAAVASFIFGALLVIAFNLAVIAAGVWVVVEVLKWTGVL